LDNYHQTAFIDLSRVVHQLKQLDVGPLKTDVSLANYTAYGIGGPAAIWLAPGSHHGVGRALRCIAECGMPLLVIGNGSNLLISDAGWPGVVVHIGPYLSRYAISGNDIQVDAGMPLQTLVADAVAHGLSGLERLAGIPGSVGGALRMNAGAFGDEIGACVVSVGGWRATGDAFELSGREIAFGYRQAPQLTDVVITRACLRLRRADPTRLQACMQDILQRRRAKQPLAHPSCGSVFKRPPGHFAGELIQRCELKGRRCGGAVISQKHAGFILNVNHATANDVWSLMQLIENRVQQRCGVQLEREVRLMGWFQNQFYQDA
jgi:UDP-N-acetylmuramate dehydrogenase